MKRFLLRAPYTRNGDTVFRSVCISEKDMQSMTEWRFARQGEKDAAIKLFGTKTFEWNDPKRKKVADYPPSGESGGIFSAKALLALGKFLEPNGIILPLQFENNEADYSLYWCQKNIRSIPNEGFDRFHFRSLHTLTMEPQDLPDVFMEESVAGLIVSDDFKNAAEAAGLTGMDFIPVKIVN